jgi:hypothetical protein
MPKQKMNLAQVSKIIHAARLTIDGSFKSQRAACRALDIPLVLGGRVSDAHTILMHGIPELVAAVESGQLAFQTGWQIAQRIPHDQQLAFLNHVLQDGDRAGRESHGLYTRRKDTPAQLFRIQHKAHDRICEAVDKLLDAIVERVDALGVCTTGARPAPEPEQGRKWRIAIRRSRNALRALEQRVDWTKTQNANLEIEPKPKSLGEGDRHNDSNIDSNHNGSEDNNSGPQD